jgi:hypothetical protein
LTWTYLFTSMVIRFPTGEPATRAGAALLRWLPIVCFVAAAGAALRPGPMLIYPAFDNPLSTPASMHDALIAVSNGALALVLIPTALAGVAIARRYQAAADVERLQMRWFAYGASIALAATVVYVVFGIIVAPDNHVVREATYALFVASFASVPIAVFQAIASHRLFEIDRIIGRTFAYGALTAILAGLYAASVRLFNWLFVSFTGEESEASLVLTTLVLATTFTPIKTALERLAARRFRFDAAAAGRSGGDDRPRPGAVAAAPLGPGAALFSAEQLAAIDARIEVVIAQRAASAGRAGTDEENAH